MKPVCNVATLIERFFTDRLMRQRNVSANTIASYRDTFRLLFMFAQARLRRSPSADGAAASWRRLLRDRAVARA
jgi:site-specific recombinase XerD